MSRPSSTRFHEALSFAEAQISLYFPELILVSYCNCQRSSRLRSRLGAVIGYE